MIERAELCVHRNSTLNAGVMPLSSSSGSGGSRRARSPHSSGRPPQQVSVRNASSRRSPVMRTACTICRPWRVDCVRPARSRAARWKESVDEGTAEPGGDLAGGQAAGSLGDQQPHQVEPGLLRERREGSGGFRCFHCSRFSRNDWLGKPETTEAGTGASANSAGVIEISPEARFQSSRKYRHAVVRPRRQPP